MVQKTAGAKKVAAGLGIAGLAAAGIAGAYFLYGKDGAKNRKKVKSWALRTKADVMDKIEKTKDLTQENFHTIVDAAAAKYAKTVSPEDVAAYTKSLKKHWKDIKNDVMGIKPKKK